MATDTSDLAMPPVLVCGPVWVADQIGTRTEPRAPTKVLPEHMNQQRWECQKRVRGCARSMRTPKISVGLGVPKTRRWLPEPLVRRQAPFGQRRFPASPRSLEASIGRRVGFP